MKAVAIAFWLFKRSRYWIIRNRST